MVLDENINTLEKAKFVETIGGDVAVRVIAFDGGGVESMQGTPKLFQEFGATVQDTEILILTTTVPALKFWRLRSASAHCRAHGKLTVLVDGDVNGVALTGANESNNRFDWKPYHLVTAGQVIDINYEQYFGPVTDYSVFLQVTEHDI